MAITCWRRNRRGSGQGLPLILADDFPCHQTGPITDIHLWASWLGDAATTPIPPVPITLGIWSDVPATIGPAGPVPSHPGVLLWSQTFVPGGALPGRYKAVPTSWAPSPFWDPEPPPAGVIMGNDNILWQYNFYPDPANAFVQQGTAAAPTNYWLSVTAGANLVAFGWRTRPSSRAMMRYMDTWTLPAQLPWEIGRSCSIPCCRRRVSISPLLSPRPANSPAASGLHQVGAVSRSSDRA